MLLNLTAIKNLQSLGLETFVITGSEFINLLNQ